MEPDIPYGPVILDDSREFGDILMVDGKSDYLPPTWDREIMDINMGSNWSWLSPS